MTLEVGRALACGPQWMPKRMHAVEDATHLPGHQGEEERLSSPPPTATSSCTAATARLRTSQTRVETRTRVMGERRRSPGEGTPIPAKSASLMRSKP